LGLDSSRTVVLAESDEELLKFLGRVLRLEGFEVVECATGIEVIQRVVTSPPSLVVCGYFLPLLDGLKVCRYVKEDPVLSGVPFVLLAPGRDAYLRWKAEWTGVDRVIELPVHSEDFIATCRELTLDNIRNEAPGLAVLQDRESILERLCSRLELRVDKLEAVWRLTEDLGKTMSVRELFRKVANGILTRMGFDRVWVTRYLEKTDELVTEVARGRNLGNIPASVHVRDFLGVPLGMAVRDMVQVTSGSFDAPDEKLRWAGSLNYVDTPLVAAGSPLGVIRCDRWVTGRKIDRTDLEALRMYVSHAADSILNAMILEDVSEEREQVAAVMNSLDSGVMVVDNTGVILQASRRFGELFGKDAGGLTGKRTHDILPVLTREQESPFLLALQEEKESRDHVIRLGDTAGTVLKLSYLPFMKAGHFAGVVVLATDMTENHLLRDSLRRKNEQLETISLIGSQLNSTRDLDKICQEVVKVLRRFFSSEAVIVFLAENGREGTMPSSVKAVVTAGYDRETDPEGLLLRIDGTQMKQGGGGHDETRARNIVIRSIVTGKPVNVKKVQDDRAYVRILSTTMSEIAVPMVVQGRIVGAVDIQSPTVARFDSESERIIVALANHAATAVENAILHSRVLSLARRDKLTGLGNLRYFEEKLEEEFRRTDRSNFPFSLIMMDIDDFKHYNDSWGHLMGNTLLKTVVKAMRSAVREVDVLIRYGGEEFVCIMPFTGEQEAAEIAERIRKKVMESSYVIPHAEQQPLGMVSISLGVATYLTDVIEKDMLLKYADQRMYMAKRSGKNRVVAPALGNCKFAGR